MGVNDRVIPTPTLLNIFCLDHPENRPQSPTQLSVIYEEVDVIRDVKTTQDVQLMSNEAYGPLHKDNVPTSPNAAYGQVKFIVLQRNKSTK